MSLSFASTLTFPNVNVAYQITIFAMWGIGVDFPRILMRYGKSYPAVMNIHSISMLIVTLLTLMYVITWSVTYYSQPNAALTGIALAGFVCSWLLVVGAIIQSFLGFVVRAEINKPTLSQNLFVLKIIHKILGLIMSILGKVTVILNVYSNTSQIYFRSLLFLIGGLILIYLILQIIYRIQSKKCLFKFPLKHISKFQKQHLQILNNLNSQKDQFPDYKNKGLRYIILDNCMYYIDQNFMHPGGQAILNIYNGQEINYLIRGSHEISPQYPRHRHTKYALNYFQSRFVGEIKKKPLMINQKVDDNLMQWKIKQKIQKFKDSNIFIFQTESGIVQSQFNIDQFGQYIMLSIPNEEMFKYQYRPYTLLRCLSQRQVKRLQRLKKLYKAQFYGQNDQRDSVNSGKKSYQLIQEQEKPSKKIAFLIKTYKFGRFTQFLLKNNNNKSYSITGPYGRGLRLKPTSKGYYVIIAAGTGVLPFMDLFTFLLQKTIAKIINKKVGNNPIKRINQQQIDCEILDEVKILFIGSFESPQTFYLNQTIKDLYHLNMKHHLNQFDMMLRYNNNQVQPQVKMIKQSFTINFMKSIVEMETPERIYYCGPARLQRDLRQIQKQLSLQGKFIYL